MKKDLLLLLLGAGMLISCGEDKRESRQAETALTFTPVALPADSLARYPHLLADEAGGRLWMSWTVQHSPDSASLWFSALDAQREIWQEPVLVSTGSHLMVNWADYPHLFLNGREPGVLYLQQADPTEPYAYHVMWKQGNNPTRRLHSDSSATEHGFVSTASLAKDQQAVIWLDGHKYAGKAGGHDSHGQGGGEMSLRFRPVTADNRLLPSRELDGRTCDCCNTAMVATPSGPVAFYRDRSEGEIRDIFYVRYRQGQWIEPRPLHEDGWKITACPVNGPAADARGEQLAVAWYTGAGNKPKVKLRFSSDAGESWGQVWVADSLKPMGRVGIQLLEGESALLSWLDQQGQLVVRQVSAAGEMGEVQVIADSLSSRKSGFPQLVRLKDKVYLAWTKPEPYVQLQLQEASWKQE